MKLFEINNMSAKSAYNYTTIHGPTPELEDIIATSTKYAYTYSDKILKKIS